MTDSPTTRDLTAERLDTLRALVVGTARGTGVEFFETLVQHLASALQVRFALLAEFASPTRVRSLAYWNADRLADPIEYDLAGTPCEEVVRGQLCHHPSAVAHRFPADLALAELGVESYLGVPLIDGDGKHLGHLCVFDTKPMPEEPRDLLVFHLFAQRAAAELERLRLEKSLRDSEERYRDLYEEAPIAYVKEDLDSRFHDANRAALRILGLTPEQVPGTVGMSFIPDTPDAQRRVKEAFASIGKGTDAGGVLLELRRKDNGKPIWIEWWSRPEPGGKYTRTMFIDVTDRVLMEQEKNRLQAENVYLREELESVHNFEEIVGQSRALTAVLEQVGRVAPTDATVLITGETGTGKELIARAIHSRSARRAKPLIKINCAALPAGLVESELFGHEKGAFTGAIARRIGRFELAHGGTLFLDEVGELPLDAQAKLLRVLQEREFERVGSATPIKTDVRILAATNRDLLKAVAEKTFRQDLYYRLSVFPVHLPPLRERREDISLLVHFLINKFSPRIGRRIEGISQESMQRLRAYDWPGNIRELENVLERAIILATGSVLEITPDSVPSAPLPAEPAPFTSTLEEMERRHVLAVLEQTGWVIDGPKGAAIILGLHPNTLRSRMKKLEIKRHDPS